MHPAAYEWVARFARPDPGKVLDLGGRDVNGSVRLLFPTATRYTAVDLLDGPGVDVVADAATWTPDDEYDVVVCCETFEHTPDWPQICGTAHKALRPGGRLILTMAGPGRPAHSAIDGEFRLHPGEWYRNVGPQALRAVLDGCGFHRVLVDQRFNPSDVRGTAVA